MDVGSALLLKLLAFYMDVGSALLLKLLGLLSQKGSLGKCETVLGNGLLCLTSLRRRRLVFCSGGTCKGQAFGSTTSVSCEVQPVHHPIVPTLLTCWIHQLGVRLKEGVEVSVAVTQLESLRTLQLIGRKLKHCTLRSIAHRNDVILIVELLATLEHQRSTLLLVAGSRWSSRHGREGSEHRDKGFF